MDIDNRTMNINTQLTPNATSDLPTWLAYLESIHPKTIELGLSRVTKVANDLDVLKPAPYVFTVAGTNGKGTTCRTLEMILIEAGFRVGVYSSPHFLHYRERVRINNQDLVDSEHVKAFDIIERTRNEISLTYFEYSTLSALYLFKQANLDVVILEVGLGGRLDATNIVDADVAVITSIAIDHTDYLGDTRESIGREKAGIFKLNRIAVVGDLDIPQSIYNVAKEKNVQFHCCKPNNLWDWSYQKTGENTWSFSSQTQSYNDLPVAKIPFANAGTALAALTYSKLNVSEDSIRQGLIKTELLGRFQTVQQSPRVIIDVAHNPHAATYLNSQLQNLVKSQSKQAKIRIVIGMLKDKDIASTVKILQADEWYCATLYGERGTSAIEIAKHIHNSHDNLIISTYDSVIKAFENAMYDAEENDIIVVCGSFHTVSEVLNLVKNG